MNITQILKALGILAIIGSGVSFLLEGWSDLTGLSKFIFYFSFVSFLFVASELSSLRGLKNILASLFLGLAPTVYAQLGSFLLDGSDKIPVGTLTFSPLRLEEGSPVLLVTVSACLILVPMTIKAVKSLQSTSIVSDVSFLIVSGLVFLVPLRSSEFHSLIILILVSLFYLLNKRASFLQLNGKEVFIRLAGIFIFIGRASLYETTAVFYSVIFFVISLFFLKVSRNFIEDKNYLKILDILGYIFLIAAAKSFLTGFEITDVGLNYLITICAIIGMVFFGNTASGIGLGVASILAWWELIVAFILPSRDFIPGLASLLVPVMIILVSLSEKQKAGFLNGAGLFILTLVWHLIVLVRFPETNVWIFLAICGVILLGLGFLIDKHKEAIGAGLDKIMEDLK